MKGIVPVDLSVLQLGQNAVETVGSGQEKYLRLVFMN